MKQNVAKRLIKILRWILGMGVCSNSMFGQEFVWTQTSATNLYWEAIVSSSDGSKLAAVARGDYIYTSTNSGVTWTQQTNSGARNWACIASSSDGTKLIAGVQPGGIYISTNSGASWTQASVANLNWQAIASSSDGVKLVAVTYGGFNTSTNGGVYASIDSGNSWTKTSAPGISTVPPSVRNWRSVASSTDGTKLVAGVDGGPIFVSRDSGANWSQTSAPNGSGAKWYSIACSSDGNILIAATLGLGIFRSTDSGTNWTLVSGTAGPNWYSVASSSDAANLVATSVSYGIYCSTNSGLTWVPTTVPSLSWHSVTSSADGSRLAAASFDVFQAGAGIYTMSIRVYPTMSIVQFLTNTPSAEAKPVVTSGFVVGATLTASGSGYTTNPAVSFVDASGLGAAAYSQVSDGAVTNIVITSAGSGYSSNTVINISQTPTTRVVIPSAMNLLLGQNYQLQIANDLNGWTNFGAAFSATNTNWTPTNYWNVANTNLLFFRLQMPQ